MRRLVTVVFVVLMAMIAGTTGTAVADTTDVRVYEGSIAGADYRAEIPAQWNGTLLLWSHGLYPPPFVPPEIGLTSSPTTEQWLLDHGYALAASNYRPPNGWVVKEALRDQIALLDWFEDHIGKPRRTVSAGSSMGGLVAVLLAERNARRFDGVASLCGVVSGSLGFWNTSLDVNFAVKTLLAPDSDIPLTGITDPDRTVARVKQVIAEALKTPQGRARLALAASFYAIPGWSRAFQPHPTDVAGQVRAQAADWLSFFSLAITWG
ncbi:MAG: alpha/beta hydrolase family protein, partial [Nocardioidaceae bacterium]